MATELRDGHQIVRVADLDLEVYAFGAGEPLLYLHANEGPLVPDDGFVRALAEKYRVVAPYHPGFGRLEREKDLREVSDLAYLYLELMGEFFSVPPILVGASFGGWIAAEIAVRDPQSFSSLVLISPLGIKIGSPQTRDIADVFAMTEAEFAARAYAQPARAARNLDALSDEELAVYFRSQESWAYYGWKPFMHNPRLKRWLRRIKASALVLAGERDRLVNKGYHEAFAQLLPAGELRIMKDAGHYPHIEHPKAVARAVMDHCSGNIFPHQAGWSPARRKVI